MPKRYKTPVIAGFDWKGKWFEPETAVTFARREFAIVSKDIASAVLFVAALGEKRNSFYLRLNGERVGKDVLSPGPSESFRARYRTYDISRMLKKGKNVLGLVFSKRVSVILTIEYVDGSKQEVITDKNWKFYKKNPYVFLGYDGHNMGKAEEYDARLEQQGWDSPGFKETGWKKAVIPGWCGRPLEISPCLIGCSISEIARPVSIKKTGNRSIVDFGKMQSGFIRLRAKGKTGQVIIVRYSERLDHKGELDQRTYGIGRPLNHYNKYILRGSGEEVIEPRFMYTGYRYAEITGYPGKLTLENIEGCFIHSEVLSDSSFECSDKLINDLQSCAVRSFKSNLVNIPTDCPGRERRGWTADAFAVSRAECINFEMTQFYHRYFEDMEDCQKVNGWIPVELPMSSDGTIDIIWPSASILINYDLYVASGDKEFVRRFYPLMNRYLCFLSSIAKTDGSINPDFVTYGDWLAPKPATKEFLAMAYFYRAALLLGRMASVIGYRKHSADCLMLAKKIMRTCNSRFLKNKNSVLSYDNDSQSSLAHALFFELVPEKLRAGIAETLVNRIEKDGRNTCGFLGTMCILPALANSGKNETAYAFVKNKKTGGWAHLILQKKVSAFPEAFVDYQTASHNHAFLAGSLSAWFYENLAGITPARPGYREVKIMPYIPEGMASAGAHIKTPNGVVFAGWEKNAKGYVSLKVSLPPKTKGRVFIPEGFSVSNGNRRIYQINQSSLSLKIVPKRKNN